MVSSLASLLALQVLQFGLVLAVHKGSHDRLPERRKSARQPNAREWDVGALAGSPRSSMHYLPSANPRLYAAVLGGSETNGTDPASVLFSRSAVGGSNPPVVVVVGVLAHAVVLAGCPLQARAIENGDLSAPILDEPCPPENLSCFAD